MKTLLTVLLISFASSALAGKKVLMMVPNDFMWPEYALPLKAYQEAGFQVKTAGRFKEVVNPDRRNLLKDNALYFADAKPITVDMSFEEVNVDNYDAVTFVAGNGAWHDFFPSDVVHKIVINTFQKNKVLGLLCASTGLLGIAGNYDGRTPLAENRKVVGYYRVEGLLKSMGRTNYQTGGRNEAAVEVDGNIITGRNPESSQIFGAKVVDVLLGRSPNSKKK